MCARHVMFMLFLMQTVSLGAQDQNSDAASFNLKTISRAQKKDIPWGLDGLASDLRSDVKHEIQKVMNSFTLLWPEAPWQGDQIPTIATVRNALEQLAQYIKNEQRKDQVAWVKTSIEYIVNTYAPAVRTKLQGGLNKPDSIKMAEKNELFPQFVQEIEQWQQILQNESNEQMPVL